MLWSPGMLMQCQLGCPTLSLEGHGPRLSVGCMGPCQAHRATSVLFRCQLWLKKIQLKDVQDSGKAAGLGWGAISGTWLCVSLPTRARCLHALDFKSMDLQEWLVHLQIIRERLGFKEVEFFWAGVNNSHWLISVEGREKGWRKQCQLSCPYLHLLSPPAESIWAPDQVGKNEHVLSCLLGWPIGKSVREQFQLVTQPSETFFLSYFHATLPILLAPSV